MKALCGLVALAFGLLVGCGKKDIPEPQAKTPETPKTDVNETTAPKIQPKVEAKNPQPPKATSDKLIADPIVEKAVRYFLKKPEGEGNLSLPELVSSGLTEADLGKVTELNLDYTKITDAGLKEVAKLQKLTILYLGYTKVTKAGVAELQKALPKCDIRHNATK